MKNTHPSDYRTVVFRDQSADVKFLTRSDRATEHSTTWEDGNVYPVIDVDVSSAAHLARKRTSQASKSTGRTGRSRGRREQVAAGRA